MWLRILNQVCILCRKMTKTFLCMKILSRKLLWLCLLSELFILILLASVLSHLICWYFSDCEFADLIMPLSMPISSWMTVLCLEMPLPKLEWMPWLMPWKPTRPFTAMSFRMDKRCKHWNCWRTFFLVFIVMAKTIPLLAKRCIPRLPLQGLPIPMKDDLRTIFLDSYYVRTNLEL